MKTAALGVLVLTFACGGGESPSPRDPQRRGTESKGSSAPRVEISADEGGVLFKAGVFLREDPTWTREQVDALAEGDNVADSCRGYPNAAELCAKLAPDCKPTPLPDAWNVCSGRGALCSEEYQDSAIAMLLARPPRCYCSCQVARAKRPYEGSPPP